MVSILRAGMLWRYHGYKEFPQIVLKGKHSRIFFASQRNSQAQIEIQSGNGKSDVNVHFLSVVPYKL